jgi:hypothetical protein
MAGMDHVARESDKGTYIEPSTRPLTPAPLLQAEPPTVRAHRRPAICRRCSRQCQCGWASLQDTRALVVEFLTLEKALSTSAVRQAKKKEHPACNCQLPGAAVALLAAVTPSLLSRRRQWSHGNDPWPPVVVTSSVVRLVRHRPDWTAAAWVAARPCDIMIGLMTASACSVTPS